MRSNQNPKIITADWNIKDKAMSTPPNNTSRRREQTEGRGKTFRFHSQFRLPVAPAPGDPHPASKSPTTSSHTILTFYPHTTRRPNTTSHSHNCTKSNWKDNERLRNWTKTLKPNQTPPRARNRLTPISKKARTPNSTYPKRAPKFNQKKAGDPGDEQNPVLAVDDIAQIPDQVDGLRIPHRQERHPFAEYYVQKEDDGRPQHRLRCLIANASIRMASLLWARKMQPRHEPLLSESPLTRNAEISDVPYALYVVHEHRGSSQYLTPVHAKERLTNKHHSLDKFHPGDLIIVTRLGRLPNRRLRHGLHHSRDPRSHRFLTILEYSATPRSTQYDALSMVSRKNTGSDSRILYAAGVTVALDVTRRCYQ
uniref:Uncharacterized protein n=1 Tax=Caenorhabditis japonica TaxID=281687 RepID=A0A8R1EE23_CAEJA